ncbi:MAG: heavy-metal-associated domain-containing protein [Candidatus Promineifilaceae bacterium]|nr:heavy-metal-associated domain-containing protein [Candidatus Promineifilaceae bacterium]
MERVLFELPAMYGDHHVMEVRRILAALPGVETVYASSAFHVVEVTFDETKLSGDEIETQLGEAGYLGDLPVPVEVGAAARENGEKHHFRHTAAHEAAGPAVSFTQTVSHAGRPVWPCPGIGVIRGKEEETING